jgi:hypothetical protein
VTATAAQTWTAAQDQALERCCAVLEAEISRQDRVLALCQEQGRAARLHDIDALEAASRALADTMNSVLRAEATRVAAVMDAARGLGITPEHLRLSSLIGHAPDPWRSRLADLQRRLRTVVGVTQSVVEANGRFLRDGARTAERLLAEVLGEEMVPNAYDREGRSPARKPQLNALLNVAG